MALGRHELPAGGRPQTSSAKPPIIEKPNPDQLRFEEAMKRDAEEEQRRNEERRRQAKELIGAKADMETRRISSPIVDGPGAYLNACLRFFI